MPRDPLWETLEKLSGVGLGPQEPVLTGNLQIVLGEGWTGPTEAPSPPATPLLVFPGTCCWQSQAASALGTTEAPLFHPQQLGMALDSSPQLRAPRGDRAEKQTVTRVPREMAYLS